MPGGFFRSIAKAAVDGYAEAKAHAQQQQQQQQQSAASYYGNEPSNPPVSYSGGLANQQDSYNHNTQNTLNQSYNSGYNPSGPHPTHPNQSPSHAEWSNQGQTHYQPSPAPSSAFTNADVKASTVTVTEIPSSTTPNGCPGIGGTITGQGYCSASVPSMDICSSCYQREIATSCFASSFKKIDYPPGSTLACDMAIKVVRDAWKNACARAGPNPSSHEHSIWLQQFAQQFGQIRAQMEALNNEITPLTEEIQVLRLQQQFQQKTALQQIRHGVHSQAIAAIGPFPATWTNAGSFTQHAGHNRLIQSSEMNVEIARKEAHLKQLFVQLSALCEVDLLKMMGAA